MLDKIERLEKPTEVRADMKLTLTPYRSSGNDVMQIEGLSKRFDNHLLLKMYPLKSNAANMSLLLEITERAKPLY